jgi:hypothetical protein
VEFYLGLPLVFLNGAVSCTICVSHTSGIQINYHIVHASNEYGTLLDVPYCLPYKYHCQTMYWQLCSNRVNMWTTPILTPLDCSDLSECSLLLWPNIVY